VSERPTVAEAMLARPKLATPATTVADLRVFFADDHVHCGLVVADGRLRAVVVRADLVGAPDDAAAVDFGSLEGRTVAASADAEEVRERMVAQGVRRLAVIEDDGRLLGLLSLKRTGRGFCSAADLAARVAERRASYDAVVVAGGRARRLGGVDKTALPLGASSILDRVCAGAAGAGRLVVVGPEVGQPF